MGGYGGLITRVEEVSGESTSGGGGSDEGVWGEGGGASRMGGGIM